MSQLAAGAERVLLVAYDGPAVGPGRLVSPSEGLLGAALVLAREPRAGMPRLRATLVDAVATAEGGPLSQRLGANAMAPMMPLFDALVAGSDLVSLHAGPGQALRVEIAHG